MSLAAAAIAAAIALAWTGAQFPLLARFVLTLVCAAAAAFGFYHGGKQRKNIHIDISNAGVIRIQEAGQKEPCGDGNRPHVNEKACKVFLLPESTLWPCLLLLLLRTESGETLALRILPDSVPPQAFSALSAACRWIAKRETARARPPADESVQAD